MKRAIEIVEKKKHLITDDMPDEIRETLGAVNYTLDEIIAELKKIEGNE